MEETFFMSPERLEKEIKYFLEKGEYYTKTESRLKELSHVYIFQPAFIEAFEKLLEENREWMLAMIPKIEEFIKNSPYTVEGKEEILWALELWKANPEISFTKMLNAAKARQNRIHSVLK